MDFYVGVFKRMSATFESTYQKDPPATDRCIGARISLAVAIFLRRVQLAKATNEIPSSLLKLLPKSNIHDCRGAGNSESDRYFPERIA